MRSNKTQHYCPYDCYAYSCSWVHIEIWWLSTTLLLVTSQMRQVINKILHYHPYKEENDYHINEKNHCLLENSQIGQIITKILHYSSYYLHHSYFYYVIIIFLIIVIVNITPENSHWAFDDFDISDPWILESEFVNSWILESEFDKGQR